MMISTVFSRCKRSTYFLVVCVCVSFVLCISGAAYYTYHYDQSVEFQNYHRYYQLIMSSRPPHQGGHKNHGAHGSHNNIFVHGMPLPTNDSGSGEANYSAESRSHPTTLVSFNIRFNAPYLARVTGERAWHVRKYGVLETLLKLPPDAIVGIQEAKKDPLSSITFPNTHYSYFGVGRDDGVSGGEFAPILFNQRFWRLLDADYKWLSLTPDVPSRYPSTGHNRIATMCKLENVRLGKHIIVLNTHLDHQNAKAREYSVAILHQWMQELLNQTQPIGRKDVNKTGSDAAASDAASDATETATESVPVFLIGDFNLKASDVAYKNLTASGDVVDLNFKQNTDATYVGFNAKSQKSVIDFIFARNFNSDKWKNYAVLDNTFHGVTVSDHRPIAVSLDL